MRYPSFTNIAYYAKHFFFKSAFGRLICVFMFVTIFNIYFFSQLYWPKLLSWLQNSTTSIDTSTESSLNDEY
jgi:hypothetical protein